MSEVIEIKSAELVQDEYGTVISVSKYQPNPYGSGSYVGMVLRAVENTTYKNGEVIAINVNKVRPFKGKLLMSNMG